MGIRGVIECMKRWAKWFYVIVCSILLCLLGNPRYLYILVIQAYPMENRVIIKINWLYLKITWKDKLLIVVCCL